MADVREDTRNVLPHLGGYRTASESFRDHAQLIDKSEWRRMGDTELVKEEVT
jgi:uncharacterized protein YbgA (DUF1722 family)